MTLSRYMPVTDRAIDVPGADGLRARRTPDDGRPAGGPLARAKPPQAGRGPLRSRLGQSRRAPIAGSISAITSMATSAIAWTSFAGKRACRTSTCSASAKAAYSPSAMPRCIPERVKNLAITITPIDFHADTEETRLERGYINVWTRSLRPEDVDRVVEAYGYLPGKFMGMVFSMLTPVKSLTKYNLDMLDLFDSEDKLLNFLRMEKWLADRPHHPGEAGEAVAEGSVPGQPAGEERVHARRAQSGSIQDQHAGVEHLRDRRPHHSAELLQGPGAARRHEGLHGDRCSRRSRRRIRRR